jgi:Uma2 family endonuclease
MMNPVTHSQDIDEGEATSPPSAQRMTVEEYCRSLAQGEFGAVGSVELLEGRVVSKARHSLRHDGAVERIREVLATLVPGGWHLQVAQPILTPDSQPEPDVAIVADALDSHASRAPRGEEIALIVEAADTSLTLDRRLKGRVYARAGILNYWLLNLIDWQLEVYSGPSGPVEMPGYHEHRVYRGDDKVSIVIGLDDLGMIRVGDMIP